MLSELRILLHMSMQELNVYGMENIGNIGNVLLELGRVFDQGKMLRNQAGIAFRALLDNRVGASVDQLILISRARLWNCNQGCASVNLQSTEGLMVGLGSCNRGRHRLTKSDR